MIPKDIFPTYAQYNEDIVLDALLYTVKKGFYIDIGANHEEYHSVTKYFYKKGWSGINIEPIPRLINEFKKKRSRDINLQLAVSNKKSSLKLREYPDHDGLSTLDENAKKDNDQKKLPYKDYTVKIDTLKNVIAGYGINHADFLKIDVEGYEREVLEGNDWKQFRPTIVCIEANHRLSNWTDILIKNKYVKFINDGLNEYYVAEESRSLTEGFAERVALLSHNAVRSHYLKLWENDRKYIDTLEDMTKRQDELIKAQQAELTDLRKKYERIAKPFLIVKRYTRKASGRD